MKHQKFAVIGTAILVTLICGAIIIPDYGPSQGIATLTIASASGFAVVALAYALSPISGCHINPAITVCLWTAGRFPARDVPYYLVAQFLGGLAGAAIILGLLSGRSGGVDLTPLSLAQTGWGVSYSMTAAFVAEMFATFVLSLVVLAVTSEHTGTPLGGVAVGLAVTVLLITFMKVSGASMNPARSFGPALLGGGEALAQLWLYCVAPILGGVAAALAARLLHVPRTACQRNRSGEKPAG